MIKIPVTEITHESRTNFVFLACKILLKPQMCVRWLLVPLLAEDAGLTVRVDALENRGP